MVDTSFDVSMMGFCCTVELLNLMEVWAIGPASMRVTLCSQLKGRDLQAESYLALAQTVHTVSCIQLQGARVLAPSSRVRLRRRATFAWQFCQL